MLRVSQVTGRVFTKQILRLETYKQTKSLHVKRKPYSTISCIAHLEPASVLAAGGWELKLALVIQAVG